MATEGGQGGQEKRIKKRSEMERATMSNELKSWASSGCTHLDSGQIYLANTFVDVGFPVVM